MLTGAIQCCAHITFIASEETSPQSGSLPPPLPKAPAVTAAVDGRRRGAGGSGLSRRLGWWWLARGSRSGHGKTQQAATKKQKTKHHSRPPPPRAAVMCSTFKRGARAYGTLTGTYNPMLRPIHDRESGLWTSLAAARVSLFGCLFPPHAPPSHITSPSPPSPRTYPPTAFHRCHTICN